MERSVYRFTFLFLYRCRCHWHLDEEDATFSFGSEDYFFCFGNTDGITPSESLIAYVDSTLNNHEIRAIFLVGEGVGSILLCIETTKREKSILMNYKRVVVSIVRNNELPVFLFLNLIKRLFIVMSRIPISRVSIQIWKRVSASVFEVLNSKWAT